MVHAALRTYRNDTKRASVDPLVIAVATKNFHSLKCFCERLLATLCMRTFCCNQKKKTEKKIQIGFSETVVDQWNAKVDHPHQMFTANCVN